ncbi:MAG: ArsA family ATPase [Planctomycetota bacterium]|nr:ArsA family ATPase [Planctomycetota bacterium]
MPGALPVFLCDPHLSLLIFGGKGGVGKTTCAVSSALHLAMQRPSERVLLLSTDPAHSVSDSLAGDCPPNNLCVIELSAEAEHRAFMEQHSDHFRAIAARGTFLDEADIDRFIRLSVPGMDELMAFLRIARWVAERSFDRIVVDTAPSGHTLKLLMMSELLETWLAALDALMAKHRYMAGLFAGRRPAASDPVDEFLEQLSGQISGLSALLTDTRSTRFVPVMLAEPLSVEETCDVLRRLDSLDVAAPEVVINRLVPSAAGASFAAQYALQSRVLSTLPAALASRTLWGAPLHREEVRGGHSLRSFTESLAPIDPRVWATQSQPRTPTLDSLPTCTGRVTIPSSEAGASLLFFAGKGGVGKTTISCAAAAAVAASGRRSLIVSTDPAHSLGDCLGVSLSDAPTTIRPGLEAIEIDAGAEFETLREEYRKELADMLENLFSGVELSFDQEAMEKLLDLAPPGLDECMALLRILDQLDDSATGRPSRYDVIVIDSAPTGHLLRLLELPQLIESWLSGLFAVFLKYDRLFRLPKLQARLIGLSRGIKRLRAMLADGKHAAVQIVSILTNMALAECEDLVESLRRMQVRVHGIILNMALPDDGTELAQAVGTREAAVRAAYASGFPSVPQAIVTRAGDPRGIARLEALGGMLFVVEPALERAA